MALSPPTSGAKQRRTGSVRFASPARKPLRLVVGIDYGTTYSGISFVTTDKSSIDDVQVISHWPNQDELSAWKVPTRIAYKRENQEESRKKKLDSNVWGYAVRPGMVSCAWTKLLLDAKATREAQDDPDLHHAIDDGILHIPNGRFRRTAQEIERDFLDMTPMDCWLTVPASWSEAAKDMTMTAAKKAGFGSRRGLDDTINMIAEPEAAAIATFKTSIRPGAPNAPSVGENVLICDCGGGTVDLTTYTIVKTSPLDFREVCASAGAKCGSTYIDRNLHAFMARTFGAAFEDLELRKRGPGSQFMDSWERVKKSYGYESLNSQSTYYLGPLHGMAFRNMPSAAMEKYDDDDGMVSLSSEDVEALFTPVVLRITGLLEEQLNKASAQQHGVNRIILVGGFAQSKYLQSMIKEWCKSSTRQDIKVLCAPNPQAAILKGAAVRGLEGTAPKVRVCKKHYGIDMGLPFREGVDPEAKSYVWPWNGARMCKDRMQWLMNKGDELRRNESRTAKYSRVFSKGDTLKEDCYLYTCGLDETPEYSDDPRVSKMATVKAVIPSHALEKMHSKRKHWMGAKEWRVDFDVVFNFNAKAGPVVVKIQVDGEEVGKTTMEFE